MSLAREINERFVRIERILNTLKTNERGGVSGGAVPVPTAQYQHLEANVTPAWANVVNLTLPDDASIGLPGAGGRLVFDLTPAPDQLKVTDADLSIATAAHGIIHVDGVAAGPPRQLLLANGTRYVPGTLAADDLPVHTHTGVGEGGTVAHSVTTGQTTDDHHAEVHVVNSTGPHAEAGLTIGHVLRATGAAAFSFGALIATDLPVHDIVGAQHSITGAQWSVVGAPVAPNTLGLFTPTDAPGAAEALLKSDAAGGLTLKLLGVGTVAAGDGTANIESTLNPLSDLDDPSDYQLLISHDASATGSGVGIGFFLSSVRSTIGAAIVHTRTDSWSKGSLGFYTKQLSASDTDPELVLTLQDDGNSLFEENVLMTDGKYIGQAAGTQLKFDDTANELEFTGGTLVVNASAADPNILATTKMQVIDTRLAVSQSGGAANAFDIYTYGAAAVPKATFKHARGTRAAPTATQSGDLLGAFDFTGYGAAFYDSGGVQISGVAAENWAVGNRGAHLVFATTPAGSAGGFERVRIEDSGNILLAPTATLDLNGIADALILDADGDTTLSAPTDDQVDFEVGGADVMTLTSAALLEVGDGTGSPQIRLNKVAGGAAQIWFNRGGTNDALIGQGTIDQFNITLLKQDEDFFLSVNDGGATKTAIQTDSSGAELGLWPSGGEVGIGTVSPGSLLELNLATEDLEFVDAGSAAATEQDWIEVQVGGVTGYIRVFAAK